MRRQANLQRIGYPRGPKEQVIRRSPWVLVGWIAGGLAALLSILVLVDYLALRGEVVVSARNVSLDTDKAHPRARKGGLPEFTFEVEQAGVPHTVVLSTYPQLLALRWTVTSPEGWVLFNESDLIRSNGRRVTEFTPRTEGPHILRIERWAKQPPNTGAGIVGSSGPDRVHVSVLRNDRSILLPLLRREQRYWWTLGRRL